MGDSEIARLSLKIYREHQRALDLIYEHRPDAQAEVKDLVEALIRSEPSLVRDSGGKKIIRFTVRGWDTPALLTSSGWTRSKRILMFEFWNYPDGLWLLLPIGPGSDETRQKLFEMVRPNPEIFDVSSDLVKWTGVFNRMLLEQEMYENSTASQRGEEIRRRWAEFLKNDLPRIDVVLKKERWIWDQPDGAEETTR